MSDIDVAGLRELYASSAEAQALLDWMAARKRGRQETRVVYAIHKLKTLGVGATRQSVIALFRRLEELGCGEFQQGWHDSSRFKWSTSRIAIGRLATGESEDVAEVEEPEDAEDTGDWLTHSYYLRPDYQIEIELPGDFTTEEAERFAKYIMT